MWKSRQGLPRKQPVPLLPRKTVLALLLRFIHPLPRFHEEGSASSARFLAIMMQIKDGERLGEDKRYMD